MTDTTKSADNPADDGDWLGYGVYADTLWARIERALAKDLIDGELGDDPMVIGIFGEWGAGKSQLLKLIERRAKASLNEQKKKRESDAGFELTVPVWFQPWKYEHEEHLHVPMVIHVLNALKDVLKHEATVVETVVNTSVAVVDSGKKALPVLQKTLEIANSVYPVIQKILKSITVFGCNVDLPDEVSEWLETAADGVSDIDLKNETKVKISTVDAAVKHTTDGSYFYRIHELLGALTRPHSYKHRKDLFKDAKLTLNTRINFVIFIDDLDRCLPEKAVQTLELIKTMFNVESFAFVLALDDEVIERGIGHRYQAYNFAGKKPEMPITGFEYLEKIVHLPFKLPALTRTQAQNFIEHLEEKIAPEGDKWFRQVLYLKPNHSSREFSTSDEADLKAIGWDINNSKRIELEAIEDVFDLSDLVLKAFDAYVPRKLTRMVELWYNTIEIAKARHKIEDKKALIELKPDTQVDARIAFTLLMVQLFHPDLYRVFRRHEQTFRAFYESFLPNGLSPSISDIDLWRWAAFTRHPESRGVVDAPVGAKLKDDEQPIDLKTTLQSIAKLADGYRFDAQQRRLPLVERLIEHRAAQRHVFDALKLFEALKAQMPALPNGFKVAQYFSLLSEFDEALTPIKTTEIKVDLTKRFTTDANQLYDRLVSVVESTQAEIATLDGFDSGHSVDTAVLDSVYQRVVAWLAEAVDDKAKANRVNNLLRGLTYLARYIAPQECQKWWGLVASTTELETNKSAVTEPKLRANWHDVRAALGQDTRFEGKYALAKRVVGDADEAPPGFVKIEGGKFQIGSYTDIDSPIDYVSLKTFYISRYLVTVAQYDAFKQSNEFKEWSASRPKEIRSETPDWAKQKANPYRPVVNVNWYEAAGYAQWLQKRLEAGDLGSIAIPNGYKLCLPDEKQWEVAARGGLVGKSYPWGNEVTDIDQRANVQKSVGLASTVGSYAGNPGNDQALYDMAGNVWEWQASEYDKRAKSLRGGCWIIVSNGVQCSYRDGSHPGSWSDRIGFRLVLSQADL